jgi:hypothetical protein
MMNWSKLALPGSISSIKGTHLKDINFPCRQELPLSRGKRFVQEYK